MCPFRCSLLTPPFPFQMIPFFLLFFKLSDFNNTPFSSPTLLILSTPLSHSSHYNIIHIHTIHTSITWVRESGVFNQTNIVTHVDFTHTTRWILDGTNPPFSNTLPSISFYNYCLHRNTDFIHLTLLSYQTISLYSTYRIDWSDMTRCWSEDGMCCLWWNHSSGLVSMKWRVVLWLSLFLSLSHWVSVCVWVGMSISLICDSANGLRYCGSVSVSE